MDTTLEDFCNALDGLANAVTNSYVDDRTMQEIWGWNFPVLSRHDLAAIPRQLASQIRALKPKKISKDLSNSLNVFMQRLNTLQVNTVPMLFNGNGAAATPAYLQTLEVMKIMLAPILKLDSANVEVIRALQEEAQNGVNDIKGKEQNIGLIYDELKKKQIDAAVAIENLGQAYQAAVNQGLGEAFQKRGKALLWRSRGWIVVLFVALVGAVYLGHQSMGQLQSELSKSVLQWSVVWMYIFLSIFNIGAPLWLAWLATIQIQKYFLLNEDYAFKTTVATTYEGYRREANRLSEKLGNTELEKRLFEHALKRLEEHPINLLEKVSHGSPFHAFLNGFIGRRELHEKQKLSATDTAEA